MKSDWLKLAKALREANASRLQYRMARCLRSVVGIGQAMEYARGTKKMNKAGVAA